MNSDGVGIVIVTYESADVVESCLRACAVLDVPIVVVDNASSDGTAEVVRRSWPAVQLIANEENRGFAAACNQGTAALSTETVLLLNPDAEPLTPLTGLIEAVHRPGVGYATGRLIGLDGLDQRGFGLRRLPTAATLMAEVLGINRLFPGNPLNRRYRCAEGNLQQAGPVEQPAGAFLLFRRDAWRAIGGLDESFYPLWFEDVDFCHRLQHAGYGGWYDPTVVARHQGAHSAGKLAGTVRPVYWYRSLLQYAVKVYHPWPRAGVAAAVLITALLRAFYSVLQERSGEGARAYFRVGQIAWAVLMRAGPPIRAAGS